MKQRGREQLEENIRQGELGEEFGRWEAVGRAYRRGHIPEIIRTGRGSDNRVRERDPITDRVVSSHLEEYKTGKAQLSKLQRKTRKKHKNYRVRRVDTFPF